MDRLPFSRWWLVVAGALSLGVAGLYQFAWSSIRGPLGVQVGASETALGTVFTVFVVFQTATQFPAATSHGEAVIVFVSPAFPETVVELTTSTVASVALR